MPRRSSRSVHLPKPGLHTGIGGGLHNSITQAKGKEPSRLHKLPFILETPPDDECDDAKNLAAARDLAQ